MSIAVNFVQSHAIWTLDLYRAALIVDSSYGQDEWNVTFYTDACEYRGATNCTAGCMDSAFIWNSPFTIHNCLALPLLSISWSGLSEGDQHDLNRHGIDSRSDTAVASASESISQCSIAFCNITHSVENKTYCSTDFRLPTLASNSSADISAYNEGARSWASSICDISPHAANLDIGGIGVFISYLMQLGLILLIWTSSRFLKTSYNGFLDIFAYHKRRRSHTQSSFHSFFDSSQQWAALLSALVDFQKAQSYFAFTMQGAALLALGGDGELFDATTYQQIQHTVSLIGDVAITGIVCITFGLFILHANRRTSVYVSGLSSVAIGIGVTTWIRSRMALHNLEPKSVTDVPPDVCAPQVSPAKFCNAPTSILTKSNGLEIPILIFCLLMTVILLFRQCQDRLWKVFGRFFPRTHTKCADLKWTLFDRENISIERCKPRTPSMLRSRVLMEIEEFIKFVHWRRHILSELICMTMAVAMLYWLSMAASPRWQADGKWSFGQLIAVTIWAPSIIEYLYSAIWGVEEAHEHRFVGGYKVVRHEHEWFSDDRPESSGAEMEEPTIQRRTTLYQRLESSSGVGAPIAPALINSERSSLQENEN